VAVSATEHARASFAVACDSVLKGVILFTRITTAPGGGKSEVFQIRPDGSGMQLVTEGSEATASPDGRHLVFTRSNPVNSIFRMNVDGTEPVDLTPSTPYDQCPVWSPDGNWIAFSSMRSGEWQLYLMRPDGRDQHRLTTSGRQEACGVSWSPDASRLTFGRATADFSGSDLVVINADGTGEQVLSPDPQDGSPAWSPDGTQIVFNSVRSGTNQIWLIQANGQFPQQLTSGAEFFHGRPLWSPDGTEVVFDRSDANPATVYRMRADGTNITAVTSGPTGWDQPSQWLP
jgi:Tol biopolymer transport system component